MTALLIGWTTTSTLEDAQKIANALVENKLAVCVQLDSPVQSFYSWQGALQQDAEFRLMIKFLPAQQAALEAWISQYHPYETPQWFTVQAAHVAPNYLEWAQSTV